jgi:hypothetical protein
VKTMNTISAKVCTLSGGKCPGNTNSIYCIPQEFYFLFNKSLFLTDPVTGGKTATQSGTKGGNVASRAVDGKLTTTLASGSCAQTAGTENNEWWSVDLVKDYTVNNVLLVSRGDCCGRCLMHVYSITFS